LISVRVGDDGRLSGILPVNAQDWGRVGAHLIQGGDEVGVVFASRYRDQIDIVTEVAKIVGNVCPTAPIGTKLRVYFQIE
jgi:hypothetical protein